MAWVKWQPFGLQMRMLLCMLLLIIVTITIVVINTIISIILGFSLWGSSLRFGVWGLGSRIRAGFWVWGVGFGV